MYKLVVFKVQTQHSNFFYKRILLITLLKWMYITYLQCVCKTLNPKVTLILNIVVLFFVPEISKHSSEPHSAYLISDAYCQTKCQLSCHFVTISVKVRGLDNLYFVFLTKTQKLFSKVKEFQQNMKLLEICSLK